MCEADSAFCNEGNLPVNAQSYSSLLTSELFIFKAQKFFKWEEGAKGIPAGWESIVESRGK